jgi:AbrB family looped-hinge helix DNA binding protein
METTKLSSKGQVILPKAVRESHHWHPGTEFVIEEVQGGVLLRPLNAFPVTTLAEVIGCTGYKGPAKSNDEIESGIRQAIEKRRADGRY